MPVSFLLFASNTFSQVKDYVPAPVLLVPWTLSPFTLSPISQHLTHVKQQSWCSLPCTPRLNLKKNYAQHLYAQLSWRELCFPHSVTPRYALPNLKQAWIQASGGTWVGNVTISGHGLGLDARETSFPQVKVLCFELAEFTCYYCNNIKIPFRFCFCFIMEKSPFLNSNISCFVYLLFKMLNQKCA